MFIIRIDRGCHGSITGGEDSRIEFDRGEIFGRHGPHSPKTYSELPIATATYCFPSTA